MLLDVPTARAAWYRFLAPGPVLWLAAAVLAARFGHPGWWRAATRAAGNGLDGKSAAIAAVVGADMAAVLIADVLTQPIRLLWLGIHVPWPISALLRHVRGTLWERADGQAEKAEQEGRSADLRRHEGARNRIALARPRSPTWIGDRIAALNSRVRNQYGLDLPSAWPRLWLTLPEAHRTDLRRANQAFQDANRLGAWSVVYAATALAWWPLAGLAAIALLSAVQSGRAAIVTVTDLAESAVDLYAVNLARRLGVPVVGAALDLEEGSRVNVRNRKSG